MPDRPALAHAQSSRQQSICVREIRVAADIGVHSHEMGRRQALIVNAILTVGSVERDDLDRTVDYNFIVAAALALGEQRTALIETYAFRLARACLDHPLVLQADVAVEKPGALTNGIAATQICLRREDFASQGGALVAPFAVSPSPD